MRHGSPVLLALAIVTSWVLAACARGDAAPAQQPATTAAAPMPDLASVHADAPGIAWFKGDVDAAFKSARALEQKLADSSAVASLEKREIRSEFGVARVYAHVEPSALSAQPARDIGAEQPQLVRAASEAVTRVAGQGAAEVVVYRQGERLLVVTSLRAEPGRSVREAHVLASRVEDAVRDALDSVDDVIVEVSADA